MGGLVRVGRGGGRGMGEVGRGGGDRRWRGESRADWRTRKLIKNSFRNTFRSRVMQEVSFLAVMLSQVRPCLGVVVY